MGIFFLFQDLWVLFQGCVRECMSEKRGLHSVESHLSMRVLKWQGLLNWSNVASAGERETLPDTDRKHKHTLILLTRSCPWCRETPTQSGVCIYAFQHTRTDSQPKTYTQLHACVHSYTPTYINRNVCIPCNVKQRCLFLIERHTKTDACRVEKYGSGQQVD